MFNSFNKKIAMKLNLFFMAILNINLSAIS